MPFRSPVGHPCETVSACISMILWHLDHAVQHLILSALAKLPCRASMLDECAFCCSEDRAC